MTVQLAAEQIESLPIPSYQKMQVLEIVRGIKPIIKEVEKEVVKEVPVIKYVNPVFMHNHIDLHDIAEKVYQDMGVTLDEMKSKSRDQGRIVPARCYFVRLVLAADLQFNRSYIGKFLNKNHCSIYHYAVSKGKCILPPVPICNMKKYKSPVIS